MTHAADVLIIGAGIAGLMAATELTRKGRRITLVDKGRAVGGRLATHRIGHGLADHGAQFFTARDPAFAGIVRRWLDAGWVYIWSHGWSDGSLDAAPPMGSPRFASRGGMSTLAHHLAEELDEAGAELVTQQRITEIKWESGRWAARTAGNEQYSASMLLFTAPLPQSLAILDASTIFLATNQRSALEKVEYAPCLCAMILLDGDTTLPPPGAVQRPDYPISWISDNRTKGISPDTTVITMHASPDWSRAHFADDAVDLLAVFYGELGNWLQPSTHIVEGHVKRWRYALPTHLQTDRFMQALDLPPLYFAGDAFGAPRVEGAVLSGLAVAQAITNAGQ